MKRQQTNIYANVQEDSVRQQEGWSHESEQDEKEQQEEDFQSNFISIQVNESQQQNTEKISQVTFQPLKKTLQANKMEYKLNQNHVKEKFSGLLNAESLVDEDNSTPRLQQNLKSSISQGVDSSKSQQAKRNIEEVLGGKSIHAKTSFKSLFQGQSKKLNQGSHSLFGTFQKQDSGVKEQSNKNEQMLQTQNRLQQLGQITQQRVYSETDFLKNAKQDTKINEMTINSKQALNGVFFNSQFSSFQKPQSISSQSKRVSTSQSRSQIDFMRGSTSGGVRPINRGNLLQHQSASHAQTPGDGSKRVKTQGESTFDGESYGQSIFFQTSRQTISQGSQNSQNNFKFKRVQNSSHTQKPSSELKSSNLSDFRNISHIQPKQKEQTQIQIETPLISQFENETNQKIKNSKQLNNIYLKMLDEFQIPYEQDIDKIKAKINELKLQSLDGIHNIDKQFVVNLLQKQVESYKIENMKARQLRAPTNRYEVETLQQWMDFMLFKIYQDKTDTGQEILEKAQLIFESCFQELFKQISTDCQERGILLQKVWSNQNEIFIKLLEEQQKQRLRYEQESLDEISRVHKMYTKEIQRLQSNLSDIISQKNKLTERFDLLKNNVKYLKKNNKYLTKMTKTLREDIEFYKKNNQDLEYAANQMKREYLNLSNSQQQIVTVTKAQNKSYNQIKNSSQSNLQKKNNTNIKDKKSSLLSVQKQKIVNQSVYTLSNIKQLQNEDSQSDDSVNDNMSQEDSYNENVSRNSIPKSYQQQTQEYLSQQQLDNSKNNQASSEENLKTINSILESQSQLAVIQAKFTKNQIQMQEISDDDDDDDIYLVDKQIDAQDWQNEFHREIEIMTDGAMNDIVFKSDIITEEKSTQIDLNIFKEFGSFLADKEVQTTDLDPEYEEKMKGQDVQGLEKFLDNISKAQDLYEKAMNSVNIPFEVKKAMHGYLKFLHKNQEQMQFLLKTEIGLKEKYHKENILLKIFKQENQNTLEELNQKIEQLEEANRIITQENQELDRNVIQLVRRTKKLTTNMEQFKQISSQLYSETSKLADNLSKTNALDLIIKKVSKGVDIDEQDIDILRNRFSGNSQAQIKSQNGFFNQLFKSQKNISENQLEEENDEENKQDNEIGQSQQFKREQNKQNTIVLSKIKSAVKQLFDLNEKSFKDDDSSSSDEEVEQLMTQSKMMKNQSKIRFSENQSPSLTNLAHGISLQQQKSSQILEKSKQYTYKFNNPKFERKKVVKVNSVNVNSSLILYNKITRRVQKSQAKMTMTKKNVCKYITNIYNEKQKNELSRSDPLHVVCYDYFLSSFGLKKVAETKILQFYEALYFFKSSSIRIKLFGQFLGLFEEYSNDELDYYLSTLKQLDEDVPNFVQTQHQLTEIVYCSFEKIISILKKQEEETNKIFIDKQISHIQKNRVLSKQNNNYPMVDVDIAMEKVLEGYQRIKQSNKELIILFTSADLDLDGVIGFYEFICLYKYIEEKEDDNLDLLSAKKLFFSKCDTLNSETGEKSLSLEAFVSMCTVSGFFRQDKVQKFMKQQNLSPSDCQNFEQLKNNQVDLIQQIKMRLIKANAYSPFFSKAIQNLVKIIQNSQIDNEQKQTTWISYRILDLESKKAILLFQMHSFIPTEFIDINMKYKDIDENDEQEQYWPSERNINYYIA
ncbi:hypothetical protein TTHERM_00585430 (macronuclear) [Tetrahymena thermophila SB210]|uniref:EF-hand domain-containing protein n=1 Tax=Tetrahymena thermophila (strain SB210) TaxID=312017 RepID=I7LTC3_TETTS|nr:hypothetical protein TTHERM_00585430 [Tetrahymena thermophila SB210]EAR84985.2 hypothetical protein TTHERM_00585430 [Tetrahymena thermophila SB210]|eukprot:XP_001032648.2 hypothetical protein TTHERM_00585430 [Tetrahymena thermophila SB210]